MPLTVRSPVRSAPRATVCAVLAAVLACAAMPAGAQRNAPPHAPLFGVWTGGFFPVSGAPDARTCRSNASVEFGMDQVGRATLTESQMLVRVIETARVTPEGWEFRFAAAGRTPSGSSSAGFGCNDADVLHVQRRGTNEIAFPGCADFPFPLVRCPGR